MANTGITTCLTFAEHLLDPPKARWPMVSEALYLICDSMLKGNSKEGPDIATRVLTNFSAYLRPSEVTRLSLEDVVDCEADGANNGALWQAPTGNTGTKRTLLPALLLSPFERGLPNKSRKFDCTVAVDDGEVPQLTTALALQIRRRRLSMDS